MSEKDIDNGGDAFPPSIYTHTYGQNEGSQDVAPGMTRRQWLAGLAMQGIVSKTFWDETPSKLAKMAYSVADAMIAYEKGEQK